MTNKLPVIHIIDDEKDLADELAKILKSLKSNVETYSSAVDFLERYTPGNPGCVVTDIRMPGISGPELQDRLIAMKDPIPIIFISGCADVSTTVRVMSKGARYLFEKGSSTHDLVGAIQKAVESDLRNHEASVIGSDVMTRYESLSMRERDILQGLLKGMTNKEMAEAYGISANTVEIHRARVKSKMQTDTLADLVRICINFNLDKAS